MSDLSCPGTLESSCIVEWGDDREDQTRNMAGHQSGCWRYQGETLCLDSRFSS